MADGDNGNEGVAIYLAVAEGRSEKHVRRLIKKCPKERREAAVNARIEFVSDSEDESGEGDGQSGGGSEGKSGGGEGKSGGGED